MMVTLLIDKGDDPATEILASKGDLLRCIRAGSWTLYGSRSNLHEIWWGKVFVGLAQFEGQLF